MTKTVLYREGVKSVLQIISGAKGEELQGLVERVDKSLVLARKDGKPADWIQGRQDAVDALRLTL